MAKRKTKPKPDEESGEAQDEIQTGEESAESQDDNTEPKDSVEESPLDKVIGDKDFAEFTKILAVTGRLDAENLDSLDTMDQEKLVEAFEAWKKKGKPKPKLAREATETETIEKLYRVKSKGKQYLYYVVKGKPEPIGIEKIPHYRQVEVEGVMQDDTSVVLSWEKKYTIPYTGKLGEKLQHKAIRDVEEPKFFFVETPWKVAVKNPDNFNGNFDELMDRARKREVI